MSIPVLMPALSPTMTEGKLAKWHVKVGDKVTSGQVICEIETDKATMEVEAVDEGTVAKILVEEGWPQAGIGAEIAARVIEHAFDYLDAPVTRVSGKDVPMPYAANLEKLALPTVAEVVKAAKAVCYR